MIDRLRTIRVRLTLWYVLLLALTLTGFSLYLMLQMHAQSIEQVDSGLQTAFVQGLNALNPQTAGSVSFTPQTAIAAAAALRLELGIMMRLADDQGRTLDVLGAGDALPPFAPAEPGFVTLVAADHTWRIFSYPLQGQGDRVTVWLQVAQSLEGVYATLDGLLRLTLFAVPFVLAAAAASGVFIADRALKPIDHITQVAARIDRERLNQRIDHTRATDELARLTHTFNQMLNRLQSAFEAERRFTADASHELRTPLTIIKGHLDVALTRQRTPDEYIDTLTALQAENDRLIRLVNNLLLLAKLDTSAQHHERETIDLAEMLDLVGAQMRVMANEKAITMDVDVPQLPAITGSSDQLIRLFLNLLDNAIKYTPSGGLVTLRARQAEKHIEVCIIDTGIGITPEHLPLLFNRFYRIDGAQGGAGLGLAIADGIVREHGGTIHIDSTPSVGTTVCVRIPCS